MHSIFKLLENKGMPLFWQLFTIFIASVSISISVLPDQNWVYGSLLIIQPLFYIGIFAGYRTHKEIKLPRLILTVGITLIVIAKCLQLLIYFGLTLSHNFTIILEELGIVLITVFAYIHILLFEKKFNIKGFAIDYTLIVISGLFFFLIISPDSLNTYIYVFNFQQKLLVVNFFVGSSFLSMSVVHYFLTKKVGLTDGVRIALITFFVIHFALEILLSFNMMSDPIFAKNISLSIYSFVGAIAILFVFVEDLSLDYSEIPPARIGNLFMWISSIVALLAIPLGVVIRSTLDIAPLDLLAYGLSSILISIIVIWRFVILIKNSNQQKKRVQSLIKTNVLTGLPNFQGYLEKHTILELENILAVHVNIEDFKAINDLYGRKAGDEVLKSLAKRLESIPNALLVSHIQSDQFLITFQTKESNIQKLLKSIQENLGTWDQIQDQSIAVPLTIGASFGKEHNPEKLAKQAELALKKARKTHSSFALYNEEIDDTKIPRHELRQILQKSIDDNFLPVHFQPIYNLEDGSLKSLELLIRVHSEKYGLLTPFQFLDQAKSYGMLTSLTQVCIKMIAKHKNELKGINVNINLPPYMLKSTRLLNNFIQLFKDEDLDPNCFCIEITEDEEISAHELIPAIQQLKENGFAIAMDDFGKGYSSLDRLSVLEVDTVKIDRSILLTSETGNNTILEWAISLTRRLGVSAVVEGVETLEQLALIKLLGADSVQGFLYSKPVSALQLKDIALNSKDISVA